MRLYRASTATVLRVTGEDHEEFLQGQGTADLRGGTGLCRYSLWLDFKGNVHGDAFVLKTSPEEMLLVSYATAGTALIEKFERHIIADDVELEDVSSRYQILSLDKETVETGRSGLLSQSPETGQFSANDNGIAFPGRRFGVGSVDILLPADAPIDPGLEFMPEDEALRLRVTAGVPDVPADTDHHSLNPLEMNVLSAVSFDKGCYLGQEVVARVHRLGRLTRRLAWVEGALSGDVAPSDLTIGGSLVGKLTSVVENSDKFLAIGWLKSKLSDGDVPFAEGRFKVTSIPVS